MLERYQRYLFHYRKKNGEPMSFRSQHALLVAVRQWFRWMTRQNHIMHNPASELELPSRAIIFLSMCSTSAKPSRCCNSRRSAIRSDCATGPSWRRLYSTGMRRMEVAGLKVYDVDFDGGTVLIRQGKGQARTA